MRTTLKPPASTNGPTTPSEFAPKHRSDPGPSPTVAATHERQTKSAEEEKAKLIQALSPWELERFEECTGLLAMFITQCCIWRMAK